MFRVVKLLEFKADGNFDLGANRLPSCRARLELPVLGHAQSCVVQPPITGTLLHADFEHVSFRTDIHQQCHDALLVVTPSLFGIFRSRIVQIIRRRRRKRSIAFGRKGGPGAGRSVTCLSSGGSSGADSSAGCGDWRNQVTRAGGCGTNWAAGH